MLQLYSTDPFFMPIHELDHRVRDDWNMFQSKLIKSLDSTTLINELDIQAQDGWNTFQSAVIRSASGLQSICISDGIIDRNTIPFSELFNDRLPGTTLEQQQSAVAEFMICLDPDAALAIMLS